MGGMDNDKTSPVQRLLDERIVFLGSEVTDETACTSSGGWPS
jgi:ATP-dependent Clp protease protease subunit